MIRFMSANEWALPVRNMNKCLVTINVPAVNFRVCMVNSLLSRSVWEQNQTHMRFEVFTSP
jgi:hypothetical protein